MLHLPLGMVFTRGVRLACPSGHFKLRWFPFGRRNLYDDNDDSLPSFSEQPAALLCSGSCHGSHLVGSFDKVQKQDWRQAPKKARGSLPSGQSATVSRYSGSESHKESGKVNTVMS